MTNLPKLRTKYGEPVGIEIFVSFPDIQNNEKTYFDADEVSGQTALSANGINFSNNQYIVLGQVGAEKTEIVQVSSTSSTLINTASGTNFAHNRGDKIQFIPYNQIVVERSTDSGSNFTALSAVDIRPDSTETYLQRTGDASTDVYRVRFYNSASGLYSAYSNNATASGFADNTVYAIKHRALSGLGEKITDLITDEFLNEQLNEARRDVDQKVLRWSFRTKFNQDIGNVIPGRYSLAVPSDLRDPNTNKNILSLRIGKNNAALEYIDLNTFNQFYLGVAHSTLNGSITSGSTSIILTASGDFNESGSVDIAAESVSGTVDNAAYTGNTESTNTLTGVTSIADSHSTARDVWQGISFGLPTHYTIYDGTIYFDVPFSNSYAGENIYADYYSILTAVDSDADTLDEKEYDMYVSYLKAQIKSLKSNGTLDLLNDSDFKMWLERTNSLVTKDLLGQRLRFVPSFSGDKRRFI